MPYGAVIEGLNLTKNVKSPNPLVPYGCFGVAKKGAKEKTKKEPKLVAIKDGKENPIKNPTKKLHKMDLGDYISKKLRKELDKEFGHTHTIPVAYFCCKFTS